MKDHLREKEQLNFLEELKENLKMIRVLILVGITHVWDLNSNKRTDLMLRMMHRTLKILLLG